MKKIYKHIYDNPKDKDGKDKPNELLGTFEIEKQIMEDFYAEQFIGTRKEDGKKYFVEGREVSGMYGHPMAGTIYKITEL